MIRYLIKPVTFVLIVGILGCTSTKWTTFEGDSTDDIIPLARVVLLGGQNVKLRDVRVDSVRVTGVHDRAFEGVYERGDPFVVAVEQVSTIERGDTKDNATVAVFVVVLAITALRFYGCYSC